MIPEGVTPLIDVKALCALLGVEEKYVYAHCNSEDPAEHWEHERFGAGRGRIRFTVRQYEAILARHCHASPAATVAEFDDAAFERGLRRLDPRAA